MDTYLGQGMIMKSRKGLFLITDRLCGGFVAESVSNATPWYFLYRSPKKKQKNEQAEIWLDVAVMSGMILIVYLCTGAYVVRWNLYKATRFGGFSRLVIFWQGE